MDDNTYRWLTAVVTPLLSVALTAIISGTVAIVATRLEAGRAEKRAQRAARDRWAVDALGETYGELMRLLFLAANGLPHDGADLEPPMLRVNGALTGDPRLLADFVVLLDSIEQQRQAKVPRSGVADAVGMMQVRLQAQYRAQMARIRGGEAPQLTDMEVVSAMLPAHLRGTLGNL
ncbi:MAG: hypothetical protein ACLQBX_18545 [Candidatus Limnocylindrales bacterium]